MNSRIKAALATRWGRAAGAVLLIATIVGVQFVLPLGFGWTLNARGTALMFSDPLSRTATSEAAYPRDSRLDYFDREKPQKLFPANFPAPRYVPSNCQSGVFAVEFSSGWILQTQLHAPAIVPLSENPLALDAVTQSATGTTYMAVGSEQGGLWLWNISSPFPSEPQKRISAAITSVCFAPDGNTLAVGDSFGIVRIFGIPHLDAKEMPGKHERSVYALAFSKDGTTLASGGFDGKVHIWNMREGEADPPIQDQDGPIYTLSFVGPGKRLATGGYDGRLRIRTLGNAGRVERVISEGIGPIYTVYRGEERFGASNNPYVVFGGWDGVRRTVDSATGPVAYSFSVLPTASIAVSPDGGRLAVSQQGTIRVWNLKDWRNLHFNWPEDLVLADRAGLPGGGGRWDVAFSDDGDWVETGDWHDKYRAYRLNGQERRDARFPEKQRYAGRFAFEVFPAFVLKYGLYAHTIPAAVQQAVYLPGRTWRDVLFGRVPLAGVTRQGEIFTGVATPQVSVYLTELIALGALALGAGFISGRRRLHIRDVNRRVLSPLLSRVEQFLNSAGASFRQEGIDTLRITTIEGKLKAYTPIPLQIFPGHIDESAIPQLLKAAPKNAAVLVYTQQPDAAAMARMIAVRSAQQWVIPIPFPAIDQAALDSNAANGLMREYAERYLPGSDLFADKNAIGDTLSFFGRAELLNTLATDLSNLQSVALFGLRKAGKTSVLRQLRYALSRQPVVEIDLQPYESDPSFAVRLFNELIRQLRARLLSRGSAAPDSQDVFPLDRPPGEVAPVFVERIRQLARALAASGDPLPIICMLDEMERVLPRDHGGVAAFANFNVCFGSLRALCQEQRILSLIVTDVYPDCNRISVWPAAEVGTNPLYSFFKESYLPPFPPSETRHMLESIGMLMNYALPKEVIGRIHELSGGHPFLSRQLASLVYSNQNQDAMYLSKPLRYSGELRDYFAQSIWASFQIRNESAIQDVLAILAQESAGLPEELIVKALVSSHAEDAAWRALTYLTDAGMIQQSEGERFRIAIGLLAQWLTLQGLARELRTVHD